MILAAGRGERMRPLTDHIPKSMLQVGGKPLIFRHLEKLADAGFGSVVINYAHLGEQIESAVGDGGRWNLTIQFSPEAQALDTAGGICNALPLLREQVFAVVNADVYSDYDYAGLAAACVALLQTDRVAHLVLVDNPQHHEAGDFALASGYAALQGERFTFSGLSACRPELYASVKRGARAKLAPLLATYIARRQVSAEHFGGTWCDVGTPERLSELNRGLARFNAD